MSRSGVRDAALAAVAAAAVGVGAAGCSVREPTAYQQLARSTSATLSSSRSTINLVHRGSLTVPYARASFVEYASLLEGSSDELRTASDAPPDVDAVARSVAAAEKVVEDPCLEGPCDPDAQIRTLDEARAALARTDGASGDVGP